MAPRRADRGVEEAMAMVSLPPMQFEGHEVRFLIDQRSGEEWLNAGDCCDVLGYGNVGETLKRLKPHHKREINFSDVTGRQQKQYFINEPGFYRLVLRSNKPEAERFQDWVTDEVLPSIRKTGGYRQTPRRLIDNMREEIQLQNSKEVAAKLYPGGTQAIIDWFVKSMEGIRRLHPKLVKAAGLRAGLTKTTCRSARQVLRALPGEKIYADAISAADDARIVGLSEEKAIEAGTKALPFFEFLRNNGITPGEAKPSAIDQLLQRQCRLTGADPCQA
jgi:prophage antirepressor-like protein